MMKQENVNDLLKALEIIDKEFPLKYPEGSCVVFDAIKPNFNTGETPIFKCLWRDTKGQTGTDGALINIEKRPKEWQYVTYKEMEKIQKPFSQSIQLPFMASNSKIKYTINPKIEEIDID